MASGIALTGRTATSFTFQVLTSGGSASTRLVATGLPEGLTCDPLTGIISGAVIAAGSSAVTLTISDGEFQTSVVLQLTFTGDAALPVITSPSQTSLVPGEFFTYTIAAPTSTPGDPVTYSIIGTLPSGLQFDAATGTISGTLASTASKGYGFRAAATGSASPVLGTVQLFASNSKGTATLPLIFLLAQPRVVNISTRLAIGTDQNVLIGGFIVTGSAPKKLIIRAIAPSLNIAGTPVPGTLQDSTLALFEGETFLGENDDWRSAQEQDILQTGVPPPDDRESALVAILNPGAYTAVVGGKDGTTGIGLIEVYDLGTASLETSADSNLANISTRGFVQTGDDVMIGGFIASGGATKVIVRAVGPSLVNRGVEGGLADTELEFVDGNGSTVGSNDDWRIGGQEQQIIDTTVPPQDDRESAIVATINPGAYTAIVRGKDSRTGVGLVEVYVLK